MNVNIVRRDLSVYQKQNRILWKSHTRNNWISVIAFTLFGAFYLSKGLSGSDRSSSCWNFSTTFGLALIVVALYVVFFLFKAKKDFFDSVKAYVDNWSSNNSEAVININSERIAYRDSQTVYERKLSVFTSFRIEDDLLILIQVKPFVGDFAIRLDELSKAELNELMSFIGHLNSQ
ncbi:MAG: hypothetical protein QM764_11460 [Chitinophagaceae bacterium]